MGKLTQSLSALRTAATHSKKSSPQILTEHPHPEGQSHYTFSSFSQIKHDGGDTEERHAI